MNRIRAKGQRGADNRGNIEIAFERIRRPDTYALISQTDVQGVTVGRRVHGHGGNLHGPAGPQDTDRNLTPIGNEDFLKHDQDFCDYAGFP